MKCAVKHCRNHSHEGLFRGLLCSPCHAFISGDDSQECSQAFRNTRFLIDEAVAIECEECAKISDNEADEYGVDTNEWYAAKSISQRIRERNL